ncbi:hypothetical protein R3P38DRAFT_3218641 [Favolaschia claudopus]|uniref:Uncharacterized protein n=1 Tax=Favolaschia claudopus TaxID=2862362 RepID=A0AAW0A2Z1_9AGAR
MVQHCVHLLRARRCTRLAIAERPASSRSFARKTRLPGPLSLRDRILAAASPNDASALFSPPLALYGLTSPSSTAPTLSRALFHSSTQASHLPLQMMPQHRLPPSVLDGRSASTWSTAPTSCGGHLRNTRPSHPPPQTTPQHRPPPSVPDGRSASTLSMASTSSRGPLVKKSFFFDLYRLPRPAQHPTVSSAAPNDASASSPALRARRRTRVAVLDVMDVVSGPFAPKYIS